MSEVHRPRPTIGEIIDSLPLPQYPCVPRAATLPAAPEPTEQAELPSPVAGDTIAKCKNIMNLVDEYELRPTSGNRTTLRIALMAEFEAARQAPAEAPKEKDEDGNNYCRILTILGMEEEGDPVAEVQRLFDLARQAPDSRDAARLDLVYRLAMVEPFIAPIATKEKWLASVDARIAQEKAQ